MVFFSPKYLQDLCQHTCSRYKISMGRTLLRTSFLLPNKFCGQKNGSLKMFWTWQLIQMRFGKRCFLNFEKKCFFRFLKIGIVTCERIAIILKSVNGIDSYHNFRQNVKMRIYVCNKRVRDIKQAYVLGSSQQTSKKFPTKSVPSR
jgi:hypothetical protein